ncbi:MAG: glycoside hydrolase family 97 protein [Candidatus Delongbacteria bacterium]|nr:glycoside hydrolase family 97 protein [Candidatus Delongbacteria bacterium]
MKRYLYVISLYVIVLPLWILRADQITKTVIHSPSGKLSMIFLLTNEQIPAYQVIVNNQVVLDTSTLGFEFQNTPALGRNMELISSEISDYNGSWELPWGEQRTVIDHYQEMRLDLRETQSPHRQLMVVMRAYDDGIAFRYDFPLQDSMKEAIIMDENTSFQLTGDHTCWWAPGDWDIYEHLYNTSPFTQIDALSKRSHNNLAQTYIPENAVNTPLTMKTATGLYLCFHEADLTDYADMTLKIDADHLRMQSELVGSDRLGWKVKRNLPFRTPWRVVIITEQATHLITSNLILNLNEPNRIGDVSWIKPSKYSGIWWEMHLGKSSWDMAGGKHGATTAKAKKLIDFSAANGIGAMLVEGWNTGWEHWIGFDEREGVFDFVTPYPDYDLQEVVRYGREKGVNLIMHHETSAAPRTYEQQLDTAYSLMKNLGIHAAKTGYVGKIIPKGEYHHGQWMVNHYQKVIETAAKYQIAIDAHEPIKDTGLRRTWPNFLSREGLRGQEFNAWSSDGGNPPEHLTIIPFTRMVAGPIDYTPGIFNIKLKPYKPDNQVNTTLAHQLALYVVIYSPIQMVPDLIENYENQPGFQFVRDVGVNWEKTVVPAGEVGDYVVIARQERDTRCWFLGAVTDENPRDITIRFDFLEKDLKYQARIYHDGPNAHWNDNPIDLNIQDAAIDAATIQTFHLAPGGGLAISLKTIP